jgi:AcrR family transcriptional regulator
VAYHHGDLRRSVLRGALELVAERGATGISLREIARRAGVSHSAPAHHFVDKAGVLTAIAAEGYTLLAETTGEAFEGDGGMAAVGLSYIRFALSHHAHFEVMFRPELYRRDDPKVTAARDAAAEVLFRTVRRTLGDADEREVWGSVVAAWSFVHGFATLWLNRNFYEEVGDDPVAAAALASGSLARLVEAGAFPGGAPGSPSR